MEIILIVFFSYYPGVLAICENRFTLSNGLAFWYLVSSVVDRVEVELSGASLALGAHLVIRSSVCVEFFVSENLKLGFV